MQDGGRHGAQRYGLTPSGAMDPLALAAANALVGNAAFAAAIEIGPFGAALTAREGAVRVALSGAPRSADIQSLATWLGASIARGSGTYQLDTSFPKGQVLRDWLGNLGALTGDAGIAMNSVATSVSTVDSSGGALD